MVHAIANADGWPGRWSLTALPSHESDLVPARDRVAGDVRCSRARAAQRGDRQT